MAETSKYTADFNTVIVVQFKNHNNYFESVNLPKYAVMF